MQYLFRYTGLFILIFFDDICQVPFRKVLAYDVDVNSGTLKQNAYVFSLTSASVSC